MRESAAARVWVLAAVWCLTSIASAADLAKVTVTAELLGDERGKKIIIQKFKNKTGYRKRQGHRQELSRVRITAIG